MQYTSFEFLYTSINDFVYESYSMVDLNAKHKNKKQKIAHTNHLSPYINNIYIYIYRK